VYRTAVSKTPQELFITELLLSELTPAERHVLNALTKNSGGTHSPASSKTIANQKTSIFRKIGVRSTDELVHVLRER
jgi:DNA-binding NarL/FixJ family response regulator